jgi:prevent-host-death family protein
MRIINIYEAKTHLSKIIGDVMNGEEIVIAKSGRPLVKLTPFNEGELPKRKGGQLKGMMTIADNFDDPLPDDVIGGFYKDNE